MRRIWSALLPLALMACSENPLGRQAEIVLEVQDAESVAEGAVVEGVHGGLSVRGVYVASTSGYTLRAFVRESRGGDVLVTVEGDPPSVSLPVVTGLEYRVSIPLSPGRRTVTVRHAHRGTSESTHDVVTQQVTVSRL